MSDSHAHALLLPEVLTLDPEWLGGPAGYLRPLWLLGPDLTPDRGVIPPLVRYFIDAVRLAAPADHQLGTVGARIIDGAVAAGGWHTDRGTGTRYVATVDHAGRAVGHEFADGPVPSGRIAVFTDARHRRPAVPAGRRVFLTAATYADAQRPVVDCLPLRELASA